MGCAEYYFYMYSESVLLYFYESRWTICVVAFRLKASEFVALVHSLSVKLTNKINIIPKCMTLILYK